MLLFTFYDIQGDEQCNTGPHIRTQCKLQTLSVKQHFQRCQELTYHSYPGQERQERMEERMGVAVDLKVAVVLGYRNLEEHRKKNNQVEYHVHE